MTFHLRPATFINHVTLKVQDLDRALQFYQNVIGFKVLKKTDSEAKLTANGTSTLLTLVQPDPIFPKERRRTGLYHLAILLPSRKDLANWLKHALEHQTPLQGASDHRVSEAIYLADPDGNEIEIYRDRPSEDWLKNGEVSMDTLPLNAEELLTHVSVDGWNGLPIETVLGHIHLHVDDIPKARDFYVNLLGFDVVMSYGSQALFLSTNQYHHHIGLNTWNGVGVSAPSEHSVGMQDFTIQYPSKSSLGETIQRLGERVETLSGVTYTTDPAGNHIKLVSG
ncbi:VOC family protein [Bacillaceae bacterium S4-13-58]